MSVVQDLTEIHRRVLGKGGPALLIEQPVKADGTASGIPMLVNLFGTVERVAWGLGITPDRLPELGETLAEMRNQTPAQSFSDAVSKLPLARAALSMRPRMVKSSLAQSVLLTGDQIDLGRLIMRWLAHRDGAKHHHQWQQQGREMPVAIVIDTEPATILSAVLPLPDGMSEIKFSGLLRGERPVLVPCLSVPLAVPAQAEIVIEGFVSATETAPEGPYGDHTGYYNSVEQFPVMRVTAITMRPNPI